VVDPRVLLEVLDAEARRLRDVAASADPLAHPGRALVHVDLVAEHQQPVRPALGRVAAQAQRERVQRVPLAAALVLVGAERVRRLVRERHAAGAEGHVEVGRAASERADDARRELAARLGPAPLAVERDLVGVGPPGLEPGDHHERVVVALHRERARARPEHLDLARLRGLHPDGRVGLARVAEQRAEHQLSHA
jgi:hypothetical protein